MQTLGKKRLMTIGLSGALALGLVGASGMALAQSPDTGSTPPAVEQGQHPHRPALAGLKSIFEASGLDRQIFADGFEGGMTVGEVLEANGVDPQGVIDEILANVEDRLDQAVTDGKIDAARATEMLTRAEEGLNALMDVTPPAPGDGDRGEDRPHRPHRGAGLQVAADTIRISTDDLKEALQGGATLADVAAENGVSAETVIDALLQPVFERIDQAVENGHIDETTAQQKKDQANARITNFVNNGPQQPPAGPPAS